MSNLYSDQLLEQADRVELGNIEKILDFTGIEVTQPLSLSEEQLNRATAELLNWEQMQFALSTDNSMNVAGCARQIHEASRVRRDMTISTVSHKKLLFGCYNTLYQRKLKLERQIEENKNA